MQESHELVGMTARTLRALWLARDLIDDRNFRADPDQPCRLPEAACRAIAVSCMNSGA
jgi:hypothetical protein